MGRSWFWVSQVGSLVLLSLSGCPWLLLTNKDWTSYHTHLGLRHENGGSIWPLGARSGRTQWLLPTIFPHRKSLKKTTIWNPKNQPLATHALFTFPYCKMHQGRYVTQQRGIWQDLSWALTPRSPSQPLLAGEGEKLQLKQNHMCRGP